MQLASVYHQIQSELMFFILLLCKMHVLSYCMCANNSFLVSFLLHVYNCDKRKALQVGLIQMNGVDHPSESIHVLHIGKMRIKLRKGKTTIAKEYYSNSMQVLI